MDEGKRPKRVRRRFTDEFKAGAVRLVLDEGKTVCGVARDLDLTASAQRPGSSERAPTAATARPASLAKSASSSRRCASRCASCRWSGRSWEKRWCVQPVVATDVIYSPCGGVAMAQLGRPGLSAQQKQELWSRWRMGQSISEIGRALGKQSGSIHGVLASNGGVTPYVKSRACSALTLAEREIGRAPV